MLRKQILGIAALLTSAVGVADPLDWCGSSFKDDCNDPTIEIVGPVNGDTVTESAGVISISFTTGTANDVTINYIGMPRNISSVSISAPSGNLGNEYLLTFGSNINNVGTVTYSGLGGLAVGGTIGGDLTGVIAASSVGKSGAVGLTIEGDVSSSGGFNLDEPNIPFSGGAQIVGLLILGDLKGDILADYGTIAGITVIGAAGEFNPVLSIDNPVTIRSGGDIGAFTAGSFNGTLSAPAGNIGEVILTADNGGSGLLVGSIEALELEYPGDTGAGNIVIDGNIGARYVDVSGTTLFPGTISFSSSSPDDEPQILIGGAFVESSEINLPANEIDPMARILINADNAGGDQWESGAEITVGTTVMSSSEYGAVPSDFGGGIIAEVPYRRHADWSTPENGGTVLIRRVDPTSILEPPECEDLSPQVTIRTYGPIYKSGAGVPLLIERLAGTDLFGNPIYDNVTSDFTITVPTTSGAADRDIEIVKTSGTWTKGTYRVVYDRTVSEQYSGAGTAELLCEDTLASGVRMASFIHTFSTVDLCTESLLMTYDLNSDETLCVQDAGEWTATPVDFNDDTNADTEDLTILLQAIDLYNSLD